MNRFCENHLFIFAIGLCGFFCPTAVAGQIYQQKVEPSASLNNSSAGLYNQKKSQDVNNPESTALFQEQPDNQLNEPPVQKGMGGDPNGGGVPIGGGFLILTGLGSLYSLLIGLFRLKPKRKTGKTALAFFILLSASLLQTYAQPPAGAKMLFRETFGGDSLLAIHPKFCPDSLPRSRTSLNFAPSYANSRPDNGEYAIAKSTQGAAFGAWWGYNYNPPTNTTYPPFYDHTYGITGNGLVTGTYTPGTRGYMLVVNAFKKGEIFYQDTIRNLCPNTHLYFEAWVGNLINTGFPNNRVDPWLKFVIRDAVTLDSITASPPQRITKATASPSLTTTTNAWQRISMNFMTGSGSGDILIQVIDTVTQTAGNDFVMDDYSVWLKVPDLDIAAPSCYNCPTDGSMKNSFLCPGEPMDLSVTYDETLITYTFGSNPMIRWLYSPDPNDTIINWLKAADGKDLTIGAPTTPTYYRVVIGDASSIENKQYGCCSFSGIIKVNPIQLPETLYWKRNINSTNWNNASNWEHADGSSVPYAPRGCIDVHIPGNCLSYPILDAANSTYPCVCNNIWFHFGGMVGKPHLLTYDSAYVQYNFGMNGGGTNGDIYSAAPLKRNQWYALAAPLQKMASGDFSLGGYPSMWQRAYETSNQTPVNGTKSGGWYIPDNYTAYNLDGQNNAIVVAAGARDGAGLDPIGEGPLYQKNMEGLKGIFQMPYFDDSAQLDWHRLPFQSNDTTYFRYYYYNLPDQPFIPDSVSSIKRGREAYKFAYEEAANFTPSTDGGKPVYLKSVQSGVGDIMIGNPFMSNLDFDKFAAANLPLNEFRLFVGNNFLSYSVSGGSPDGIRPFIAPLQAFFINPPSATLKFSPDDITTVIPASNPLRASGSGSNMKPDVLYLNAKSDKGQSWLTLSMQDGKRKNLILLLPDSTIANASLIPQIYATDVTAGQKNAIQYEGGYVELVPIGVLSAENNAQVTLTIENLNNFAVGAESIKLRDTYLNKEIDLRTTNVYQYQNVPATPDRFQLVIKTMTGIAPPSAADDAVHAYVAGNTLYVNAGSKIADVSVIALQGITVAREQNVGQTSFSKSLNLPSGLYLVSVKLATGETKVVKVIKR